ncbi:MAG: hypothetical protein E6K56_03340, partial [Ignavibacteria bacterium]
RDLWTIYESLAAGREPNLPPLMIQYGDFVHWQREWLASQDASDHLSFWKRSLSAPLPVLDLPTDQPSQTRSASEHPMETLLLPQDVTQSLKGLCKSEDVSMFMLTLTAYSVLLHRYTHQADFVIGSPAANRRPETEPLIGPFAGPVSLRVNLSGNPSVRDLLHRTREIALNAMSHAEMPFEMILEKLAIRWTRGRNPLSQAYFFYQTAFLQPRDVGDLTITPLPDFGLGTHFELQLGLLERREGVRCQLEYNPNLFHPATIRRVLTDYQKILVAMVKNPAACLDELPVSPQPRSSATRTTQAPSRNGVAREPDDIETRLIKIWRDVLCVRLVDLHDNYFELGGTSLLAVRLFSRIETAFNVKLPLSTLFEAQTVEELAHVLRRGNPAAAPTLIAIQPGGSRPRFFCIHAAGGNVLIYRALSRHLGPDQPLYGLQAQGLDGERPCLTRVEDMAALYVREIRQFQPHGPYLLGGYCLGGTIALEMAQQLRKQNESVGLLALFDTMNWSRVRTLSLWGKARHRGWRLIFHAQNFMLLKFKEKITFLREKLRTLHDRTRLWRGIWLGRLMQGQPLTKSPTSILAEVWGINDRAALNYAPKPYPGVITDFRPMRQYAEYAGPEVKWDCVAAQEIVTLPVYPAGMLLEPFVRDLAAALKKCIDKTHSVCGFHNSETA